MTAVGVVRSLLPGLGCKQGLTGRLEALRAHIDKGPRRGRLAVEGQSKGREGVLAVHHAERGGLD